MTMLAPTIIEGWISDFLASPDPTREWLKEPVRQHKFLPLYLGWFSTIGLLSDCSFVRWDQEEEPPILRTLSNAFLQRMALCQGIEHYPQLVALLPTRPDEAVTCSLCGGVGDVPGLPQIICVCGGIGWSIPEEDQGESPG
jgi:hypothetical protein